MAELATLGYTILAGLLGVAFFLGRLSTKIDSLQAERIELRQNLHEIFNRLDVLAQAAAKNDAWHRQPHAD